MVSYLDYLCPSSMEAILPADSSLPSGQLRGYIHNQFHLNINLSPPQSHFSDINVLGTDFMYDHDLVLLVEWKKGVFSITKAD